MNAMRQLDPAIVMDALSNDLEAGHRGTAPFDR
jgi:hypothetical protein